MPYKNVEDQKRYWREHREQKLIWDAAYRERHREKKRKRDREYYYRNKEKCLAFQKQYYQHNRSKVLERCKAYNLENPERSSWRHMLERCYRKSNDNYKWYGGRGVTVCEAWQNSFETFLKDLGPRPKGTSIDRINPNGNYEPANCRWATQYEQVHNRRKR